jgi:hypothetical protein
MRDSASGALKNCKRFMNPDEKNPVQHLYLTRIVELLPEFEDRRRWIKFKPKNKQHTPNLPGDIFPA